jgi:hypothetical protein
LQLAVALRQPEHDATHLRMRHSDKPTQPHRRSYLLPLQGDSGRRAEHDTCSPESLKVHLQYLL